MTEEKQGIRSFWCSSLWMCFSHPGAQTQLDRTTPRSGAPAFTSRENYQFSPNQCNLGLGRRRDNSEISLNSMFGLKWPPREKRRNRKEKYELHILSAASRSLVLSP